MNMCFDFKSEVKNQYELYCYFTVYVTSYVNTPTTWYEPEEQYLEWEYNTYNVVNDDGVSIASGKGEPPVTLCLQPKEIDQALWTRVAERLEEEKAYDQITAYEAKEIWNERN